MAKRYFRDFIIMKENNSDYSIQGKSAVGKCILEIKDDTGKILFTVSNLKPEVVYRAYVISSGEDRSRGVHIGNIVVNQSGNGTLKYEGDADNILNTGLKVSEINSVGIIIFKPEGIITPLIGYKNEEIPWKHNFYDITKENERNREEERRNPEVPEGTENLPEANPESEPLESENPMPETQVPENPIPETQIPENPMPETQVPENPIPENRVPENPVPETQVPENPIPETPEPVNEEVPQEPQSETEEDQTIPENIPDPTEVSSTEFPVEAMDTDELKEAVSELAEEVLYEKEDEIEKEVYEKEEIQADLEISSEDTVPEGNNIPEPSAEIAKEEEDSEAIPKPDEELQNMFKKMAMKFNRELKELEIYTNLDERGLLDRKALHIGYCKSEEISSLEEVLNKYQRSKPFKEEDSQYIWVNISFSDISDLPLDRRLIMNDPAIISMYRKYNHMILGKDMNTNKYLFGVPDIFYEINEKKMEMLGFHMFKCCDLSEVYDEKHGYWLMVLNK